MARPGPIAMWPQYLAARLGAMALTSFSVQSGQRAARGLGRAIFALDRKHRQRAMNHVRLAFPDWPESRIEHVARASIENFMALAVEVAHTTRVMHVDTLHRRARPHRVHRTLAMLNDRRPVIMLTGHFGNWEVPGFMLSLLGYDVDAIARPIDNPLVNDWVMGIREARGMRIISKRGAGSEMADVLRRRAALAFIADQNAGDRGLFVPFFGKLASAYKSIGLLALRHRVPVVCAGCIRTGDDFRFDVREYDIIEPADWENQPDPLFYVTARYVRAIEAMVRETPEQYLWMHRRWKTRPFYERENKPMPAEQRQRLEALPWMTPRLMAQVSEPIDPALTRR